MANLFDPESSPMRQAGQGLSRGDGVLECEVVSESEQRQGDFPGGPVVKNLPSNAGDMGLLCGRGTKIPQAAEQLSLLTTATEPKSSRILLPQLETLCTMMKIPGDTSKTRPSEINRC